MTATDTTPETESPYLPDVPLSSILKHPKNPRHRATADADMVASVRTHGLLEPLVLAPHPDQADKYILIAGHRRIDALKKAKRKTAEALVRRDLRSEAQQLEVMLVENLHREDLTAIEEAEGYAQLELLGFKAPAIAAAVGRDVKTVRARLKLLKLSTSTRKKVHAGQLNLEDAVAMTEFANDPDATKKLEHAAGKGYDFKYQLQSARRHRDMAREAAKEFAKLVDAGANEVILKKGQRFHSVRDADKGPVELTQTFSTDWGQHKKCLGAVTYVDDYSGTHTYALCMDPASHADQLDEAEREDRARREQEKLEHEAKEAAKADAAAVRIRTLIDLVGTNTAMPPALRDLVRALLPVQVTELYGTELAGYQNLLNIPEAARWPHVSSYNHDKATPEVRKLRDHLEDIAQYSDGTLTRALVALLVLQADANATQGWNRRTDLAGDYLDLLTEAGHPFCDVDEQLRAEISGTDEKNAEVEVA